MRRALAISPHLDDAVFSCGGTLATLASRGWTVTVATVFTASVARPDGFALACQLDKGIGAEIDYMALRRDEDAAACQALGLHPPVWMPFREAPHRGYGSAAALFAGLRDDDTVNEVIGRDLKRMIAVEPPDLVLAPQGVGAHVDHVQVVRALRSEAGRLPVLWWTDFPYSVRADTPTRPFEDAMTRLDCTEVVLSADALDRKRLACRAYASQIGFQFGGPEGLDQRLDASGGAEAFRVEGRLPPDLFSRDPTEVPAPREAAST